MNKFCKNCGAKVSNADSCQKCGTAFLKNNDETSPTINKSNPVEVSSEVIIKCGNCDYIGPGEPARTTGGMILAWLCVVIFWPITVIYFLTTSKYRCPKCKSTFLGIKNKDGVFAGQKGGAGRGISIFFIILIIIAVIGILSSVVLASLNSARSKGADAAIKSYLGNARAQSELYYDGNGQSYFGVCDDMSKGIYNMKAGALNLGSGSVVCNDSKTAWAMSAQLKTNTTKYWCVDNTGVSDEVTTGIYTQVSCY